MSIFSKKVADRIDRMDTATLRRHYLSLSDKAAFFESIVQSLGEGVVVFDDRGTVTYANDFAQELIDAKVLPPFRGAEGVSVKELEITYPEHRIVEIRTAGRVAKLRDITAERAREADDLESGKFGAVKDIAAQLAHEIGNPLNALSLNLQLMKRRYRDDPDIESALREVKRLSEFGRGFLDAFRPAKVRLAPGSVADPLKDALSALRNVFEDRKIRVTLDLPPALPSVALDRAQMEQVYFNIVKNAIEAMKDGGELAIDVAAGDRDVAVSFRDSGGGMDEKTLAELFSAYRTSKRDGTGLGLMISKRIVSAHGGEIAVKTEAKGTVFTVRLPRLEKRVRELSC